MVKIFPSTSTCHKSPGPHSCCQACPQLRSPPEWAPRSADADTGAGVVDGSGTFEKAFQTLRGTLGTLRVGRLWEWGQLSSSGKLLQSVFKCVLCVVIINTNKMYLPNAEFLWLALCSRGGLPLLLVSVLTEKWTRVLFQKPLQPPPARPPTPPPPSPTCTPPAAGSKELSFSADPITGSLFSSPPCSPPSFSPLVLQLRQRSPGIKRSFTQPLIAPWVP